MKIKASHKCFLAFAFLVALTEIIVSLTYQFHAWGFTLGLIYFVCTPVLYFTFFDKSADAPEVMDDSNEPLITEEKENVSCAKKSAWCGYICAGILLFLLMFVRIFVLCRRTEWRSDLNDHFPTECGDWSAKDGCTRLVLAEAGSPTGCVKTGDLADKYDIVFDVGGEDLVLNKQIQTCVDSISGSKLHSPGDIDQINTLLPQVHITFQSSFFGFIDDMYVTTTYYAYSPQSRVVEFES